MTLAAFFKIETFFRSSSSCCRRNPDSGDGGRRCNVCTRSFTVFGVTIPTPLSAGTFFSASAFAFGITAVIFYLDRTANRNLTPAESRELVDYFFHVFLANLDHRVHASTPPPLIWK
jgi:hypothetical protein